MPEGDTIHKIAAYLEPRLVGTRLTRATIRRFPGEISGGTTIRSLWARGKHLFMELDDGRLLRSHLGMHGSWHRYRHGESWKRPERQATLELHTNDEVYVCFNAKEIELLVTGGVRQRILETRLGPDMTCPDADLPVVLDRARTILAPDAMAVDLLLDQRIASGIGNVYKSEILFLERVHPETPWRALEDTRIESMFSLAHRLLRKNLGGGPRMTRFAADGAGHLWVYGRTGRPCFRCVSKIVSRRLGHTMRSTFWCPRCAPKR